MRSSLPSRSVKTHAVLVPPPSTREFSRASIAGDFPLVVSCSMAADEKQAAKRVEQLRQGIEEHNRRYYEEAAPTISDREYDRLYKELVDLETRFPALVTSDSPTQRVGGKPLEAFAQIAHRMPMLSLDNTYSEEEVANFYARITRLLAERKNPGRDRAESGRRGGFAALRERKAALCGHPRRRNGRRRHYAKHQNDSLGAGTVARRSSKIFEVRGEVYMDKRGFEKLNDERNKAGLPLFANPAMPRPVRSSSLIRRSWRNVRSASSFTEPARSKE